MHPLSLPSFDDTAAGQQKSMLGCRGYLTREEAAARYERFCDALRAHYEEIQRARANPSLTGATSSPSYGPALDVARELLADLNLVHGEWHARLQKYLLISSFIRAATTFGEALLYPKAEAMRHFYVGVLGCLGLALLAVVLVGLFLAGPLFAWALDAWQGILG